MTRPARIRLALAIAVALLLFFGACFRLTLVSEYRVPAVDGLQYYALSQQLLSSGRFAFAPPPAPPTYSRLPGYPLFLAYVAVRQAPVDLGTHLLRATRVQALLDVGTALLVFLVLRTLAAGTAAAFLGLALVLVTPLLFVLASHTLTETLATFLATLELFLAVRAMAQRHLLYAVLAGAVAGFAQLVRADAVTLAQAVILALACARAPARRRLLMIAACGLAAAAVFAPWPIRNLRQFQKPYFAAWQWRTATTGKPLPTGPIAWARTFSTASRQEFFLDPVFAFEQPFDPRNLLPWMYDSPAERQELLSLIARYNRERLSPEVDAGFRRLADERARRAPFRTYVELPLRRLLAMFESVPNNELSMKASFLGLPQHRPWVRYWDWLLYLFALGGAGLLWWRQRTHTIAYPAAAILLLPIAVRCAVLPLTVPMGLSQRFLIEAFPMLIALAACGAEGLGKALRARALMHKEPKSLP